jgi:tetratricopeptide (TPR) repeat protein
MRHQWRMGAADQQQNVDFYAAGLTASGEGRHTDAIACFERALREAPDDARVLFALGNTAAAIGHAGAAENFFRRVLAQEPGRLEALVNLANLLRKSGRTADVIALIKPVLESNPEHAELWLTLGSALRETGDATRAEAFYREALRLSPDNAAALGNLADLLADQGDLDEALNLYQQAITSEPENAQARFNRAILLFLKGELRRGWREYEYRHRIKERILVADHGLPMWAGRRAEGMILLVTAEQGIGDQIMFASVIPALAQACAQAYGGLIIEAESRLVPLFARSFPGITVRPAKLHMRAGQTFASYDWLEECGGADAAIAIGSLPRLMRQEFSDFPAPHAYLKPDDAERAQWSAWLRRQGGAGPFLGLCWRSGSLGGLRNLQYAPLASWADFLRRAPGNAVSLQYDAQPEEIEALQHLSGRTILVPPNLDQKQEIDRTTALIAALDAVVSAPTSVSWMSAAAGVPTLKILYNKSWTSFGRASEPFAPAARCIMPAQSGDWDDAFSRARSALSALLPRRS